MFRLIMLMLILSVPTAQAGTYVDGIPITEIHPPQYLSSFCCIETIGSEKQPAVPTVVITGRKVAISARVAALPDESLWLVRFECTPIGQSDWRVIAQDFSQAVPGGDTTTVAVSWDTSKVQNGIYELRALVLDRAGRTSELTSCIFTVMVKKRQK